MTTTHASTETLKGLTIVSILINHYLNLNINGDFRGFANLTVVVFFILSSYGIYHSLERTFTNSTINIQSLSIFYLNRAIKIFPLFWIAYILETILFGKKLSLLALLGLSAPGHYWFIPAILQCYAIAPFVYFLIKKKRIFAINAIIWSFVFVNISLNSPFLNQQIGPYFNYVHLGWRNCFFLYIFVFSLSMLSAIYLESWDKVVKHEKLLWFYYAIILVSIFMISGKYTIELEYLFNLFVKSLIPIALLTISTFYFISNRLDSRIFSWLGKVSFSVFLFHFIFYKAVNSVSGFGTNSITELFLVLIFFPFFLFICRYIDRLGSLISETTRKGISSHYSAARPRKIS